MTEVQLKFADQCINTLLKSYPKPNRLSNFINESKFNDYEYIIHILERDKFIIRNGVRYKITDYGHANIDKYGSYSNFISNANANQIESEQKEQLDTRIAELTEINLALQNKDLKIRMLYTIIGFILGAIVTNLKEILLVLKIMLPPETK